MSVTRYRDVAEMPPSPHADPRAPETNVRIAELWSFSARFLPPLFTPGVYRYRSIEASQAAREERTIERMRAVRAARTRRG